MEGKFVVVMMSALLVVFGQIHQAEAAEVVCCPDLGSFATFKLCYLVPFITFEYCAKSAGCTTVEGTCPDGSYNDSFLPPSATANEFCKSGCVSSVCAAMTTLQVKDHSSSADASPEVVNGAIKKCSNACSAFCANGNKASVITTTAAVA